MSTSRPNKPKSSYHSKKYNFKDNRFTLQPDLKGFLCTCSFGEKDCQKEAINLLREYSEKKEKLTEDNNGTEEESADIMDSMDNELQNLSNKDNSDWKKFTPLSTGVGNCVFIGTTIEDPCELMYKILEDIEKTKVQKTKFLLRMIPISITCKATIPSIKSAFTDLFAKHFTSEPTTFAIMFNHRYNNSVKRDQIIVELANQVAGLGEHTVDLSGGAKKTIIVEVVKSMCCLSVVEDYGRFYKFNLLSVSGQPEKRTKEGAIDDAESGSPPKVKKQEDEQVKPEETVDELVKPEETVNEQAKPEKTEDKQVKSEEIEKEQYKSVEN